MNRKINFFVNPFDSFYVKIFYKGWMDGAIL